MTRTSRAALLTFAITLAMPAAGASADAQSSRAKSCKVRGSQTIDQNRTARVYEVAARGSGDVTSRLFACIRRTGRKIELEEASDNGLDQSDSYGTVRLNGRFVAWSETVTDASCRADCPPGFDGTTTGVTVRDLRARRARGVETSMAVTDLVVTTRGIAAWIEGTSDGAEVRSWTPGSSTTLLDSGAIALTSLRLVRDVASWRKGGSTFSATLAPGGTRG